MDAEALVARGELVEVLLEQDVLLVDVGEDEVELGLVAGGAAADHGADHLQHGRDARAAGDHAEVPHHVGRVDHGALGAAHLDRLPDDQRRHVLGDVARRVRLDQHVEVAGLVVAGDGGVGADDLFLHDLTGCGGGGEGGGDGDVLADWETEDGCCSWEGEAVAVHGMLVSGLL